MRKIDALLVACLSGVLACSPALAPLRAAPVPAETTARQTAAEELGRLLFEGLRERGVGSLQADGIVLDALYFSAARGQLLAEQSAARSRYPGPPWSEVWDGHEYAGICLQGSPLSASSLGLREPAWVVDRALVVARRGTWRSAAWVTGTFVLTTRGFQAIAISQVEEPRPAHSDLELAPCDVQRGL